MLETIFQLLLYSLPPALVMAVMGIVGVGIRIGPKWNSAILRFAGGVAIAVVGVELIPDILEQHNAAATCIGFALGAAAMLAMRFLLPSADTRRGGIPKSLLMGTGVDLLIGIGLAAGAQQGLLISEAHESTPDTPWLTGSFLFGFLVILLFDLL